MPLPGLLARPHDPVHAGPEPAPARPGGRHERRIRALPLMILLGGLATTALVAAQVRQLGVEEHIRIERNLLDDVGNAVATKLAVNVALLSSVAGLIRTTPLVDRRSFGVFHASIAADSSSLEGIQGIGFARWLSAAELPAFERRIRAEGFTSFRVRPAGRRPELSAIEFLEPFDWRNRRSFGFDMHSEPTRRQAMERAARSGLASLSGRVRLLQETPSDVQAGVVLYLPVFEENPARLSGDDRPERLLGWAYSPLRVRDLIRSTLVGVNNPDLGDSRVVVYDGRATVEANLLFDNEASLSRGSRQPLTHPSFRELELVGHTWTVGIQLGPHLIGPSGISSEFWVVLLGGITVSSLLAMASRLLVDSHLATRRALAASEAASQERALASTVFEASSLAIVVTNPDGFILTANNAFTLLSGYRLSEIVGQRTNLLKSGRHDGDFYAAMWDTLLGKGFWEGDLWNKVRNGELRLHHLAISSVRDEQLHTRYYVGMLEDITDRHAAEQAVRFQALHDTLTGLANRSLLMEQLEREVALGHRHNRNFGLLYIDLDGFKPVNDRLGHAAGDCLLSQVAERLRHGSRESDIICRQGGDEFVVLVPQAGSLADLHSHGAKLLALLQEPFELQSSTVRINASIGIARFPDHGPSADALLQAADAAMYGAKTAGGGQVRDASAGPA